MPHRAERGARRHAAAAPLTLPALVLAFLLLGALVATKVLRLEIMARSGVVVMVNPLSNAMIFCSLRGCYRIDPS